MKGDQMGIRAAYPTPRELPLSNRTRFSSDQSRVPSPDILLRAEQVLEPDAGEYAFVTDPLAGTTLGTPERGAQSVEEHEQGNEFRLTDLIGTLPIALRGAFPGRNNGISEQDRTTVAGPDLRSTSKSASDTLRHRGPLT